MKQRDVNKQYFKLSEDKLQRYKNIFSVSFFLLLYLSSSALLIYPGEKITGSYVYLVGATGMFIGMLGLWKTWLYPKRFYIIIIVAILVRIGFVFQFPHGDDIHRYIWEGKIQLDGHNPFKLSPHSKELKYLRDSNWKKINHKDYQTIYWPFAQQLFKLTTRISPTIIAYKILFTIFDIGLILILILLIFHFKIPIRFLILYALNPVVLIFISGEAHLEIIMIFWLLSGCYLSIKKRFAWMYICFGLAIMTKITPIILLPLIITKKNILFAPFLLIPALLVIPYLNESISLFHIPFTFLNTFRYNGLVYTFLRIFIEHKPALIICKFSIVTICATIFFITPHTLRSIFLVICTFLIFSPTFHPWYLLLLTPFLVFFPSPPWILLHLTILPLIFYFDKTVDPTFWRNKDLLMNIEYYPFLIISIWYLVKGRRHWPAKFPAPKLISVIIPTFNEENNIERAIVSIEKQSVPYEIIVVDGGSTDSTITVVSHHSNINTLISSPGRGIQIAKGVKNAKGDIILILHADSRLLPDSLSRLLKLLEKHPDASGGAFKASYENRILKFRFTEFLNNMRTLTTGISFGDQAQFFRKEAIGNNFPKVKLMEDIELSLLTKTKGSILYIKNGVISSTRKWKKSGFLNNFIQVISLSIVYIARRKFGLLTKDNSDFYRLYYGKK